MSDQAVSDSLVNSNMELINEVITLDPPLNSSTHANAEDDDDIIVVTKQNSQLLSDSDLRLEEEEVMEIDQIKLNNSPDVQIISENSPTKNVVSVSSTWIPALIDNNQSTQTKTYLKEPRCQVCSKEITFNSETIYWEMMLFCRSKCFASYDDLLSTSRSFKQTFGLKSIGHYCLENRESVEKYIKNHEELSNNKLNKAYLDFCQLCLNKKPVEEELLLKTASEDEVTTKVAKFCGLNCFSQFRQNHSLETFQCDFCSTYFVRHCSDHTIFYNASPKSFCSKLCLAVYFTKFRKKVRCATCEKVEKHNFNMIERIPSDGFSRYYCSLTCLNGKAKVKRGTPKTVIAYHKPGMPIIQSVSSLALCNESITAPNSAPPPPPKTLIMKEIIRRPMIKCVDGVSVKNKIVVAKPYLKNAEISCQVEMVEESTQTDSSNHSHNNFKNLHNPRSALYPITVPFYMPLPLRMYSLPCPVPIPVPVCVPVPVLIPIESGSLQRIQEKINDLKSQYTINSELILSRSELLDKSDTRFTSDSTENE